MKAHQPDLHLPKVKVYLLHAHQFQVKAHLLNLYLVEVKVYLLHGHQLEVKALLLDLYLLEVKLCILHVHPLQGKAHPLRVRSLDYHLLQVRQNFFKIFIPTTVRHPPLQLRQKVHVLIFKASIIVSNKELGRAVVEKSS